jgi:hypothetical protein
MMRFPRVIQSVLVCATLVVCAAQARAVVLYSSDVRNTDAPGSLTNRGSWNTPAGTDDPRRLLDSGWQWEGIFDTGAGNFLGTPIAPNYFITAAHVAFGNSLVYHGQTYSTNGNFTSPDADLRIWRISGTFDSWAPMYDAAVDGSEVGKSLVVIGRGRQRGAPVFNTGGALRGWQWGTDDGVQSWGENVVSGITDYAQAGDQKALYFDFDAGAGPNEAALSGGDSGGGVYILSGGIWKLAGINLGADTPWRTTANGTSFDATIFNGGGLFFNFGTASSPNWQQVSEGSSASSYATRISADLSWIDSVINAPSALLVPEPTTPVLAALGSAMMMLRRRRI